MKVAEKALLLAALFGLMHAAISFAPEGPDRVGPAAVTMAVGFVLLASWAAGRLFAGLGLPRLTGYIATGIVCGPSVLGYMSAPMLGELRFVGGAAVALIALTAGGELDLRALRPLLRTIASISATAAFGGALVLGAAVFFLSPLLPFMEGLGLVPRLAIAFLVGVTLIAQSPAVVMAIRSETQAQGPVTQTILGVVVLGDLAVVVMFAIAIAVANAALGGAVDVGETTRGVLWELFGSMAIGLVIGGVLALWVRRVKSGTDVFVLGLCLVVSELAPRVHLDPLLTMITAGAVVENAAKEGKELIHSLEASSMPVFVLFFTLAGAGLHLSELWTMAIPVLVIVAVRAGALVGGTRIGGWLAGSPAEVSRWAGFGLLPQAGLAIALSMLLSRAFPQFGESLAALTLGVVATNELVMPAVLRWAWLRSGEAQSEPQTSAAGASIEEGGH